MKCTSWALKPNSLVKKSNIWSLVMSTVGNSNAWSCFGAVGQSVRPHSNVVSGNGVHSDLNPILLLKRISRNWNGIRIYWYKWQLTIRSCLLWWLPTWLPAHLLVPKGQPWKRMVWPLDCPTFLHMLEWYLPVHDYLSGGDSHSHHTDLPHSREMLKNKINFDTIYPC